MRELTQNELNDIAGGDRQDAQNIGMAIGAGLGFVTGSSASPAGAGIGAGVGAIAGNAIGGWVYDVTND